MGKSSARLEVTVFMVLPTLTRTREMTGHFDSDGPALSGYLSSPEGRTSFTGTVEGKRLRFDVHVVQPVKITLKYGLEVEGNRLVGKVRWACSARAKWKGRGQIDEKIETPA
jgi:aerobic carbon-monoxide dehydrogenase large subunit